VNSVIVVFLYGSKVAFFEKDFKDITSNKKGACQTPFYL
jgi:hypothetical protein